MLLKDQTIAEGHTGKEDLPGYYSLALSGIIALPFRAALEKLRTLA